MSPRLDAPHHSTYAFRVQASPNILLTSNTSAPHDGVQHLAALLAGRRVLVLSGAGVSTESGIPDYRGPESIKKPRNPMRYKEFVGSAEARRRYWARSFRGWLAVHRAAPNGGHRALAGMEARGAVGGVITQNVDGLHQGAGSRNVLELHGSLAAVKCLECGARESRRKLQARMLVLNPTFETQGVEITPDGDAEIPQRLIDGFTVPGCLRCGGVLKPDVVFFGENVPKERVLRAYEMLARADALLVVGSSLTVFSGYRFVARAKQEGKPVAIINQGPTRGDGDAVLKVEAPLGEVLPALAALLPSRTGLL